MINLSKMHSRVTKLTKVFTDLVDELDDNIETLEDEICTNNRIIDNIHCQNDTYSEKIAEYSALKNRVSSILGE